MKVFFENGPRFILHFDRIPEASSHWAIAMGPGAVGHQSSRLKGRHAAAEAGSRGGPLKQFWMLRVT